MNTFTHEAPKERAMKIVQEYVKICAGTAFATGPMPGTTVALATIEAKMCYDISKVYGYSPTKKEIATILGSLALGSGILKGVAIEIATWIPFIGWGVKSAIAYAGCHAVGMAIIEYYENY